MQNLRSIPMASRDLIQGAVNFVFHCPGETMDNLSDFSLREEGEGGIRSSVRFEVTVGANRYSVKQFLYDWAPPAYGCPSLWIDFSKVGADQIPPPIARVVGNDVLWIGKDFAQRDAAAIISMGTMIEITARGKTSKISDFESIFRNLIPCHAISANVAFAERSYFRRFNYPPADVPLSLFNYQREKEQTVVAVQADEARAELVNWPQPKMQYYTLDSIFLFKNLEGALNEVEFHFVDVSQRRDYCKVLVKNSGPKHSRLTAQIGDQPCSLGIVSDIEGAVHAYRDDSLGPHEFYFEKNGYCFLVLLQPSVGCDADYARNVLRQIYASV